MKTKFLLPLILIFIITSCSKEEAERLECETEDIGYLTITNAEDDAYYIYIDGNLEMTLQGNTFVDDYELDEGLHNLYAEQKDGYLLWPTIFESTISLGQCEKLAWVLADKKK